MTVYEIVLYRDEGGEAAVESKVLGTVDMLSRAMTLARSAVGEQWQTADVTEGEMESWSPERGVRLYRFTPSEHGERWLVTWVAGKVHEERA